MPSRPRRHPRAFQRRSASFAGRVAPRGGKPLKPDRDITDPRLAKALAHPLRVRILGVLDEGVASPSQIAGALGAPLGVVAYHVRRLAALGFVELVSQSERRGAVEHHYRATDRPVVTNEAWADVPAVAKAAMVSATLAGVGDHVAAAAGTGGFDRSDAHLTRSPMVLDEEGWREVAARLDGLLQDLEGIASEAERRLAEDDHQGEIRATAVLMLFEEALPHAVPERALASARRRGPRLAALDDRLDRDHEVAQPRPGAVEAHAHGRRWR